MKQPKYPVYIISKGRWESRMTARTLEENGTPYRIVIEEQEYDQYAAVIDPKKILVLPFKNLGLGGIPARNWVWEHSISEGHERHWILDDNIRYLYRLYNGSKLRVKTSLPFIVCEDYTDRFTNVGMSGLNYHFFAPSFAKKDPAYYNTRVYSFILIRNDMPYRWRVLEWEGKNAPYNEDTDLSLQCMKGGYCTILLNSFLAGKAATHTMKGGNTTEVYKVGGKEFDNRYAFAASLAKAHPDVCHITTKHGRYHHQVDYSRFQKFNKLELKPGCTWPEEYQHKLKLVKLSDPTNILSKYEDADVEDLSMGLEL